LSWELSTSLDVDFCLDALNRALAIWQPKTKRNRAVPISDALFAILKEYRTESHALWFFPSPTGKRWDPDNFSQDLRAINKPEGLDWSCMDYRHTFGSHLAQKGESLYKIATLMGNSPEICRRHYAALIPEEMRDTVEFQNRQTPKDEDISQISRLTY
jgi:integrase